MSDLHLDLRQLAHAACRARNRAELEETDSDGLCVNIVSELDGLWGSQTFLEPTSIDRQLRFRGVIAQLVSLASFYHEPHYRELAAKVSDELWRLRFSSRLWLHDADGADHTAFCDKILAAKPDSIIWLMPTTRTSMLAYRLMNCGIRVIRATAVAQIIDQLLN